MTHLVTARWLLALILVLGACRGGDDAKNSGADEAPGNDLEIPPLPELGELGELETDPDSGSWSLGAGYELREEYRCTLFQTSRVALPNRAPIDHRMRQTFTLIREVTGREDDLTWIRMRIKDASFQPLDADGAPLPPPAALASFAPALERVEILLSVDPRGKVESLEVSKATNLPRGMEDLFHQLIRDLQVVLPPDAAAPGDQWEDTGELVVEREKSKNIVRWRLEGTYQGMVDRDGTRCAVVDIQGDLQEEGKVDRKEISGSVLGRGQAHKVALLEADTGRLMELRMVSALARRVKYGKESREKARIEELTMELSLRTGTADEENN